MYRLSVISSPCYKCEDRQLRCHSSCNSYQKYQNDIRDVKKIKSESKSSRSIAYSNGAYGYRMGRKISNYYI